MSTQRGNTQKSRGQKHQNKSAFKNSLHDTSWKRKQINSVVAAGVCQRCKDAIDWKIKYKKYKPLSQPKTCTKCHQKAVKQAYYTICISCAQSAEVCQKCGEKKEIVILPSLSASEQAARDAMHKLELKQLTERQRRTFFRLQESGKQQSDLDNQSHDHVDDDGASGFIEEDSEFHEDSSSDDENDLLCLQNSQGHTSRTLGENQINEATGILSNLKVVQESPTDSTQLR